MIFNIQQNEGVDIIDFGMSPEQIRETINTPFKSFKRSPMSEFPCDFFPKQGVFVYYKKPGIAEAMEFAMPAQVKFQDVELLDASYGDIVALLTKSDPKLALSKDGLTSKKLGVGVYAPQAQEEPDEKPTSIIVFEKGYYD